MREGKPFMSILDAFKRAWSEVERGPASPSDALLVGPAEAELIGPVPAEAEGAAAGWLVIGPSAATIISPSSAAVERIEPSEVEQVVPPPRPAWDDRGWSLRRENGQQVYEGFFQVKQRQRGQPLRYAGRIIQERGQAAAYIADPPPEIKKHPKGPCFMLVQAPWFRVNWYHAAGNVDDAILYVEKVLDEAVNHG
jgi:hypothetical protein